MKEKLRSDCKQYLSSGGGFIKVSKNLGHNWKLIGLAIHGYPETALIKTSPPEILRRACRKAQLRTLLQGTCNCKGLKIIKYAWKSFQ